LSEFGLAEEVRQFLAAYIASVEQLEVLLLLRAGHERVWSAREIYERVMTNVSSIQESLDKLSSDGLVAPSGKGTYRFSATPEIERVLEQVAMAYKEMPTRILSALYGTPSNELKAFADAFRIKKQQ
jgi:hypothetical protein